MPTTRPHAIDGVLVVGGGYAGLHAARTARKHDVPVTIVDRAEQHSFVTRLAAVAGGTAPLRDGAAPMTAFADQTLVGSVESIGDGTVTLADGRRLDADAVVVTTGAEISRPPIDGIEHAPGLRSARDAVFLRARIAEAGSLLVVGGGATGVQLAGAAAHAHPDLAVHVFDSGDRLLGGLPRRLATGAERILKRRGVDLHLGRDVERILPAGLEAGGESFEGLVVWAGGFSTDAGTLGVATDDEGRIVVGPDLLLPGHERTFAAGDIAGHVDRNGDALPMSAQIAVKAGDAAGANAARVARGCDTVDVNLRQIGWVLELGGGRGVAAVGPVHLTEPLLDRVAPFLHDGIDLKNLLEIGGIGGLRFAPQTARTLLPLLPMLGRAGGPTVTEPAESGRAA